MNPLLALIDLIFRLASLLFLIRFLLQVSNADYYNQLSQAIIKATDKIANPFRRILRPYKNLDLASLTLAYVFSLGFFVMLSLVANTNIELPNLLLIALARSVEILLGFYWWSILITIVSSFFVQQGIHPAIALLQDLVEPILAPARRLIPALGPIDLSPIFVLFTLSFLQNAIRQII